MWSGDRRRHGSWSLLYHFTIVQEVCPSPKEWLPRTFLLYVGRDFESWCVGSFLKRVLYDPSQPVIHDVNPMQAASVIWSPLSAYVPLGSTCSTCAAGIALQWLKKYTERLHSMGVFPKEPNHVLVNEYEPGQGIMVYLIARGSVYGSQSRWQ